MVTHGKPCLVSVLHRIQYTLYTIHYTVYIVVTHGKPCLVSVLHRIQYTLYSIHYTVYIVVTHEKPCLVSVYCVQSCLIIYAYDRAKALTFILLIRRKSTEFENESNV